MYREALLSLALLMLMAVHCAAQTPYPDKRIAYAPDIVGVDRLFMIALTVPVDAPDVAVSMPDSVVMLDHTGPPTPAQIANKGGKDPGVRRFYFRSVKPSPKAEVRFALPDGELTIPIVIWSFDDLRAFRELKGTQLPRRWPLGKTLPELKEGQTVTTDADRAAVKGSPGGAEAWLSVPDDEIWNMQPDSTIPRWHWVNIQWGCPVHGQEIYKKGAYYPWGKDVSRPYSWKIKCPVGDELYPSNNFAKGDFTSGDFPDDGIGGGCVVNGKHYGFVAELAQYYAHQMLYVAPTCARGYLATGDVKYVHKALVAFSRLAVEYAYLATMTQHRHRNSASQVERFGQGRFDEGPCLGADGFTIYCIDQPGDQWAHAEAYDAIWPAIDKDPDIIPFLQKKGFPVNTSEDVRRFIEENLFAVWMQGSIDGATHSNEPYHQRGLARMAEMLNYKGGADFMDWLYDGIGRMRIFVPNTFFRDGAPYESTGGYNGMHVTSLGPIVDSIEHMRAMRPEVYPEAKYPSLAKSVRYRNVFDFAMDAVTIDRFYPEIGDGGSFPSYHKLPKLAYQPCDPGAFEHAYRLYKDPKYAWALVNTPGWKPPAGYPYTLEQIQAAAAKLPADWNDKSSIHDGYGIAILRGGKGDNKRALWMMYGHNRGHSHDDIMDIGLQGYQGVLLSHMGYPRNWGNWEPNWMTHLLARQIPFSTMTARPELFADAGIAHVAEARGAVDWAHTGGILTDEEMGRTRLAVRDEQWQRRTLALVDVGPDQFYCVDLYRIAGGKEHWWTFHAQEGDFQTQGLDLIKQPTGTLAGADVSYGDRNWLKAAGCSESVYGFAGPMFGFAHLYNVQRAPVAGPWSADWALKTGDGLHLRLTVPSASGTQAVVCDGKSPAGASPYEMKWVLMHNKKAAEAPGLQTQVLSIIEPYLREPLIQQTRPLKLSGADEQGFTAAACELHLADRTDTVLASADGAVERTTDNGVSFAGRFGLYAEKDGAPVAMSLIGGTRLQKGGFGIVTESPEYRAKITKVDRATETLTVSPAPPEPSAIVGATVFLTNDNHRLAYKVLSAKAVAGGAELHLAGDSRIGTGQATGTADLQVKTSTPFPLQSYGYYNGARIVSADGKTEYRITEAQNAAAVLIDGAAHPAAKADALAKEFPTGSWFNIYDYGVGDEVVWPYAISVTRTKSGVYEVQAPCPVTLTLPDGAKTK